MKQYLLKSTLNIDKPVYVTSEATKRVYSSAPQPQWKAEGEPAERESINWDKGS